MTSLIKSRTNDAVMADRLKQYEDISSKVDCSLHNSPWSYFDSINQSHTRELRLKSIYHLISRSTWQELSRHRITFLDLHCEVCWDEPVSGTVKLDSSSGAIDCHSQPRDDWLPEYFSLQTSHFLCTQTGIHQAWGECDRRPWVTAKHAGERGGGWEWEAGWRVWVSTEVCWGSSGRPGHMVALGGICIKFTPPHTHPPPQHPFPKIVSSLRPSKGCHITSSSLLFILLAPPSHTHTHTSILHFESSLTQTVRGRKGVCVCGGGSCMGSLAVWAELCVRASRCVAVCIV